MNKKIPLSIIEKNIKQLFELAKSFGKTYFDDFSHNVWVHTEDTFCMDASEKIKYYNEEIEKCKTVIQNYNISGFKYSYPIKVNFKDHEFFLDENSYKSFTLFLNIPTNELIEEILRNKETGIVVIGHNSEELFKHIKFDHFINILCKSIEFYYYKYLLQIEIQSEKTSSENFQSVQETDNASVTTDTRTPVDTPSTEKKDLKHQAKYLKPNGERYTHSQIALFIIYKNYQKRLYDPRRISDSLFHQLAIDFGYTSKTSAEQIYDKWNLKKGKNGPLQTKSFKNEQKDLEEILKLLNTEESLSARNLLEKYYDE